MVVPAVAGEESESDQELEEDIDASDDNEALLPPDTDAPEESPAADVDFLRGRRRTGWRLPAELRRLPACLAPGLRPRKIKGVCPLCGESVGKGAHACTRVHGRIFDAKRSDLARGAGNQHFRARRYGEAVKAYSSALLRLPDDPKTWSNLAAARTAMGSYEKALQDSEEAIHLAPAWPKGYLRKARALEALGRWGPAAGVYGEILERCPGEDGAKVRRRRATCLAREALDRRVRAFPPAFAEDSVRERWQKMRRSGAEPVLEAAEAGRRMREAEAAKAGGNEGASRRDWAAARDLYARGVRLLGFCPQEPFPEQLRLQAALMLNQALCDGHLGNHRDALSLCSQVLELDPASTKALFRRAQAFGELEEFDAALDDLSVLLALHPGEAEAAAMRRRLLGRRRALQRRQKAQFQRMLGVGAPPA